jgi:hypothetical protein
VRRRILLERRTAAPCHPGEPNREMTAGRDLLRRHTHFFAAAALSYTNAGPVSVSRDSLRWISSQGSDTASRGWTGPQTVGRYDRLVAAGAVGADPPFARPGPLTGGRK